MEKRKILIALGILFVADLAARFAWGIWGEKLLAIVCR